MSADWTTVLELASDRTITAGSESALCRAIRQGADLRICTAFRHGEHIDPTSPSAELVRESADFRCTYLLDDQWSAGIMTLRQPIALPDGFGPRPSMSMFLYNQNGDQAIARPHLDGIPAEAEPGPNSVDEHDDMPKYHESDHWDEGTNAPSSNFIYDFEFFRFAVRDDWREVLSHTADGTVVSGSIDALVDAIGLGHEIKIAVRGLCADLADDPQAAMGHEVFIQIGSCYHYDDRNLFIGASHPLVRVAPAIPMRYATRNWDFGWLMTRTDGRVVSLLYDPYTLGHRRAEHHYALRWFVR